jgi:hypothetical protein
MADPRPQATGDDTGCDVANWELVSDQSFDRSH